MPTAGAHLHWLYTSYLRLARQRKANPAKKATARTPAAASNTRHQTEVFPPSYANNSGPAGAEAVAVASIVSALVVSVSAAVGDGAEVVSPSAPLGSRGGVASAAAAAN